MLIGTLHNRKKLIDYRGNAINDIEYTYISSNFLEGLSAVKRIVFGKELLGFINEDGLEAIACRFDGRTYGFYDGLARIFSNNKGKWAYVNKEGIEITDYVFDDLYWLDDKGYHYNEKVEGVFFDDLRIVKSSGKFGCIDRTGKIIVICKHDEIKKIQNGVILVGKQEDRQSFFKIMKYGCINYSGEIIIEPKYDAVQFYKSFIKVYIGKPWIETKKVGMFSLDGTLILQCQYNEICLMDFPFVITQKNEACFLVNLQDNKSTYLDYEKIRTEDNFIYSYQKNGKIGWMFSNLKKITEPIYDLNFDFIKGRSMYISLRKKIDRDWKDNFYFKEGFQKVKRENKFGFIDLEGKEVIKCIYDNAESFYVGYAKVSLNGIEGYINYSGEFFSQKEK